ncbi:Hpt domain-containing protein [Roseibacterium sp. SDUM158017]|uniref:Hpt domain-containing protein n=1 Tax=Roseicyclus salinarum TaxID=3036773 RepID=UPI00241562C9|nr:Hpt domain-containing protein [Roseibacterium sp. SDUM158017]MDG4649226.1 Hpt domain-containing protein [Roseibacterium sp. SDUM158017]
MTVTAATIRMKAGLEDLRAGFLERVADRCMTIECILAGAESICPTEAERAEIAQHAHKTVGVAATFGYAALGARALEVERLMSPGRTPSWDASRPIIDAFLDEMERVLDEEA